jgi:Clathrin adaptor complex small chain
MLFSSKIVYSFVCNVILFTALIDGMSNLEKKKLLICRYASLYFCMCIDANDNELEALEIIHHFVEILDRYFGSVSQTSTFVLFCLFFVFPIPYLFFALLYVPL